MAEIEKVLPNDIQGTMRNGLIRLSNANSVTPNQVLVKIFVDGEIGALGYELSFKDGVTPSKRIKFLADILGIKADSFNREHLLNMAMLKGLFGAPPAMKKLADEFDIEDFTDLHMMIYTKADEPVIPRMVMYHGERFLREVLIKDLM